MLIATRRGAVLALLTLQLLNTPSNSQPAAMTWPEAVAPLAGGKSMAESCVALLKRYGTAPQIANGQLTYTKAKSDSDAVIAGLVTVLATGDSTTGLPSLQSKLTSSLSELEQFCGSVKALLPTAPPSGEKGGLSDALSIVKEAIGPLLTGASAGIAALYNNYRDDKALTRKSIQEELKSARWPEFADVKPQ
jgi:hypothetical protein